jgi:DNA-binding response OmpR family regulator
LTLHFLKAYDNTAMGLVNNIKTLVGNDPSKPQEASQAPASTRRKVLIVEDDLTLKDFYSELMKEQGYDVLTAENGQVGLQMVMSQKPNLVLLDIMMPVMDGKAMLHEVRKIPEFKTLPVVILTNAGDIDTMRETQRYDNANAFLIKSNVSPQEVIDAVKAMI